MSLILTEGNLYLEAHFSILCTIFKQIFQLFNILPNNTDSQFSIFWSNSRFSASCFSVYYKEIMNSFIYLLIFRSVHFSSTQDCTYWSLRDSTQLKTMITSTNLTIKGYEVIKYLLLPNLSISSSGAINNLFGSIRRLNSFKLMVIFFNIKVDLFIN